MTKKMTDANTRRAFFGILIVALPLSGLAAAGTSAVQSSNRFAEDIAEEILRTLPKNALVIQGNWDIQSPVIYLQAVEKKRTDVVMLDLNLLQRPWYLKQEMRAHSKVFTGCEKEIEDFIREVAPFEAGKPFISQRIESAFLALVNGMIVRQMTLRPVYVRDMQAYGHPGIAANLKKSPGAYFLRIGEFPDQEEPVLNPDAVLRGRKNFSERERFLLTECAMSSAMRGMYALRSDNMAFIERMMQVALAFDARDSRIHDFVKNAELRLRELKDQ